MSDIQRALRDFNPDDFKEHLKAAEDERAALLEQFPLDGWPDMALEDYALGQDKNPDNFSRLLERYATHLGSIRGGSATKFVIYKKRNEPGWYYKGTYPDEKAAWQQIRAAFVQMLELAQDGEWHEIDNLEAISGARAVRCKTLHLYFPDDILPVYSVIHMSKFLKKLSIETSHADTQQPVRMNRTLLDALRQYPETDGWTTNEIERFLYWWDDPREESRAPRIVKIAPGETGRYWDDCLANNYMRVGWGDVGDLRDYEDEAQFKAAFQDAYAERYNHHAQTIEKKADEVWTLLNLEPGDKIVANRGVTAILGVGTVVEPGYEWLSDVDEYPHIVHVKWDTTHAKDMALPDRWRFVTIAPISQNLYQRIINASDDEMTGVAASPLFTPLANALERKGQVILHGPPGTGKTYHALRFAEWWLAQSNGRNLDDLTARQTPPRTWWVVANPRQWHWDNLFRDGSVDYKYGRLQRNYPQVQKGDLVIGYLATPDKRIDTLARVTKAMHNVDGEPRITLEPVHRIDNGLTYAELQDDPLLSQSEPIQNRCQGTLFKLTEDEATYLFSLLAERDSSIEAYLDETASETTKDNQLTLVTFHPSYSYEDFIEGFRPQDTGDGLRLRMVDGLFKSVCVAAQANPNQKYLIVVDEINRANLAKVFGEIITLLERDKRGISVVLPQSKERFHVPENVYLLGTMNTSDRSIRLMDAALRRRFGFIEVMPDMALLRGAQINGVLNLDDYVDMLNRRISRTQGREKQIGHAFFLEDGEPISDATEFARRFRQEILPLLQEYCYDDYSELADYLGTRIVDIDNMTLRQSVLDNDERLVAALADFTSGATG